MFLAPFSSTHCVTLQGVKIEGDYALLTRTGCGEAAEWSYRLMHSGACGKVVDVPVDASKDIIAQAIAQQLDVANTSAVEVESISSSQFRPSAWSSTSPSGSPPSAAEAFTVTTVDAPVPVTSPAPAYIDAAGAVVDTADEADALNFGELHVSTPVPVAEPFAPTEQMESAIDAVDEPAPIEEPTQASVSAGEVPTVDAEAATPSDFTTTASPVEPISAVLEDTADDIDIAAGVPAPITVSILSEVFAEASSDTITPITGTPVIEPVSSLIVSHSTPIAELDAVDANAVVDGVDVMVEVVAQANDADFTSQPSNVFAATVSSIEDVNGTIPAANEPISDPTPPLAATVSDVLTTAAEDACAVDSTPFAKFETVHDVDVTTFAAEEPLVFAEPGSSDQVAVFGDVNVATFTEDGPRTGIETPILSTQPEAVASVDIVTTTADEPSAQAEQVDFTGEVTIGEEADVNTGAFTADEPTAFVEPATISESVIIEVSEAIPSAAEVCFVDPAHCLKYTEAEVDVMKRQITAAVRAEVEADMQAKFEVHTEYRNVLQHSACSLSDYL